MAGGRVGKGGGGRKGGGDLRRRVASLSSTRSAFFIPNSPRAIRKEGKGREPTYGVPRPKPFVVLAFSLIPEPARDWEEKKGGGAQMRTHALAQRRPISVLAQLSGKEKEKKRRKGPVAAGGLPVRGFFLAPLLGLAGRKEEGKRGRPAS